MVRNVNVGDALAHGNRSILILDILEDDSPEKMIVNKLAQECLDERDYYYAAKLYIKSGNLNGLQKAGELALTGKNWWDAYWILRAAGMWDRDNIVRRSFEGAISKNDDYCIKQITEAELWGDVKRGFDDMCRSLGSFVGAPRTYDLSDAIKTIHAAMDNYDCAVGIARGGLFSSHVWSLFGKDVYIVQPQRMTDAVGRTTCIARFRWATNGRPPKGAKILVIENDLVTGKTLEKVAEALSRLEPAEIGLCLNDNVVVEGKMELGGSPASNIPSAYTTLYAPNIVSYKDYINAFFALKEAIERKQHP